jgi:uncharacterized protein (TIGR02597 family)
MKHNVSLLTGALLVAATGCYAQTAVTDPVGYITINVAGTAAATTYSAIAPTLVNKVEFSGVVTAISGDGKTLSLTGLTASAFGPNFWLEITNGTGEGAWTNIVSNSATGITVSDAMTTFVTAGTTTIKVRQHVTIAQFFGANNTAGLQGGADPGQADEVVFLGDRGVASQNVTVFYDPGAPGWFNGDFAAADNLAIEPGVGMLIARKAHSNTSFVQVGHVKTGKSMTSVLQGPTAADFGENVIGVRSAVGVTLAASNLFTGNNATGVRGGDDPGLADEVIQFVGGAPKTYFFDTTANAWSDGDFAPAGSVVLAEGTGIYLIRKQAVGDFVWTAPAVTIAP